MPFIAVLCLVLLFGAAVGDVLRRAPWYEMAYRWGVFFLAVYLLLPTLKALGL